MMFYYSLDLLCEICVIYMNRFIRYASVQYADISNVRLLLLKGNDVLYFCPYSSEY